MLSGRDLLAAAQTGTGKTAGFVLPLLQRLVFENANHHGASRSPAKHPVRALILVPTRELAAQVHESVRNYGAHVKISATVIYGGVGMNPQIDALRKGVDIVVVIFYAYAAWLGWQVTVIMQTQMMVVIEWPMSIVFGAGAFGLALMAVRSAQVAWKHWSEGGSPLTRVHDEGRHQ